MTRPAAGEGPGTRATRGIAVRFLGGAGTVTGSRFLVETTGARILVDCGLFQGLKQLRLRNWAPLPLDPASLDAVVLTHAHIDHSGLLPVLVREGYRGPIYATAPTVELCGILLPDSGHIQEEDAAFANRHGFSKHKPALPLYDEEAARRVLFSGDLGQDDDPICEPPEHPGAVDAIVMESTYGDRLHGRVDAVETLGALVRDVVASGGTLLIPAFAVGRVQALLLWLDRLFESGKAPRVPVVVDSPMATSVTELYHRHHGDHRLSEAECRRIFGLARFVRKVEESKAIAFESGPLVLISASGMLTGGRVLHHFKRIAPDPAGIILLPGFQAPGTRGAALLAGADSVKVHGSYVPVRARIEHVDAFSAHADRDDLLDWLGAAAARPKQVILVHGEPLAADSLRHAIEEKLGLACTVAEHGQVIVAE